MSAHDTLLSIAQGQRPQGLLHSCRLTTDAGEAYGIEAVSAHFRAAPLALAAPFGSDTTLAAATDTTIVLADTYSANVARIWRIGSAGPVAREARIDVAFDADMTQARGDVFASASDFPDVPADIVGRIVDEARAVLAGDRLGAVASRDRLFLMRVASDGSRHAALFANHRLSAERRGDAGFRHVAMLLDGDGSRWFTGPARVRAWTPRV